MRRKKNEKEKKKRRSHIFFFGIRPHLSKKQPNMERGKHPISYFLNLYLHECALLIKRVYYLFFSIFIHLEYSNIPLPKSGFCLVFPLSMSFYLYLFIIYLGEQCPKNCRSCQSCTTFDMNSLVCPSQSTKLPLVTREK